MSPFSSLSSRVCACVFVWQIVPTVYRYLDGRVVHSNQYAVTEHVRHINPGSNRGLPGASQPSIPWFRALATSSLSVYTSSSSLVLNPCPPPSRLWSSLGVWFFYDTSPVHVELVEKRRGYLPFFTSVCAIVGGIFSVRCPAPISYTKHARSVLLLEASVR